MRAIEFAIAIRATPQTLWEHLTNPELIPKWSYMKEVECDEVRVGGLMAYATDDEADEDGAELLILEPPHHLAYRWFSSEPEPTLVEYRLEPDGPYTVVHFRNS
ncbi:MAG TPA: SRPBCC domain-containing protein, partial [bacterium]|nr:SRPBCC domain-containing protein [bacterium]